MTERTLSIVKPDAVAKHGIGAILAMIEASGLRVVARRDSSASRSGEAERFYAVHRERPFFRDLSTFMTSGPVFVGVLEGEDAIATLARADGRDRPGQGATGHDPRPSAPTSSRTPSHGSDAPETARRRSASSSATSRSPFATELGQDVHFL